MSDLDKLAALDKAALDRAVPRFANELPRRQALPQCPRCNFFHAENDVCAARTADPVNHPTHYNQGGIETIDFIEAKQLNFNLGNVVKYLTRAGIKDKASYKQDLEKARWYLNREIKKLP